MHLSFYFPLARPAMKEVLNIFKVKILGIRQKSQSDIVSQMWPFSVQHANPIMEINVDVVLIYQTLLNSSLEIFDISKKTIEAVTYSYLQQCKSRAIFAVSCGNQGPKYVVFKSAHSNLVSAFLESHFSPVPVQQLHCDF